MSDSEDLAWDERPIRFNENWSLVTDADEETFIIYSHLASKQVQDGSQSFNGLGFVDPKRDTLTIPFRIPAISGKKQGDSRKRNTSSKRGGTQAQIEPTYDTIEIELAQDKTSLQSRKGDTGSVLWKLSVVLGQLFLDQLYSHPRTGLFDLDVLSNCHVLELGSGTGLLSILLSPWVGHYTATDLDFLLPLIRKNIALNSSMKLPVPRLSQAKVGANVSVESLDWLHLLGTRQPARAPMFSLVRNEPVDLIVVVDCIFNPSLLEALVESIEYFSISGRTLVMVALELRADDVVREFLDLWIRRGMWRIWRVEGDADGELFLDASYAIWIGMKVGPAESSVN